MTHPSFDPTPERRLLFLCTRPPGQEDAAFAEGLARPLDWPRLQTLLIWHGLFPLFYRRLRALRDNPLDPQTMARFRDLHLQSSARALVLCNHLLPLLDRLRSAGVTAVPTKGPVLAQRLYGDIGARVYDDLDLLLLDGDHDTVTGVFAGLGYRPMIELGRAQQRFWQRSGREFVFFRRGIMVDTHRRLSEGPAFYRPDPRLRDRLVPLRIEGRDVPVLPDEDRLLILCMHGTKHHWEVLKWLADVAHLVDAAPNLNWDALASLARRAGARTTLASALGLARNLAGVEIPAGALDRIDPGRGAFWTARYERELTAGGDRMGKVRRRAWPLGIIDTGVQRLRYLLYYLFTPKYADIARVHLPGAAAPLYYLLRPPAVMLRALGLLGRRLTGRR